jgi:hypothetical protein
MGAVPVHQPNIVRIRIKKESGGFFAVINRIISQPSPNVDIDTELDNPHRVFTEIHWPNKGIEKFGSWCPNHWVTSAWSSSFIQSLDDLHFGDTEFRCLQSNECVSLPLRRLGLLLSSVGRAFQMGRVSISSDLCRFSRLAKFIQLPLGGLPKTGGRAPQRTREYGRRNDSQSADYVMIDALAQPVPKTQKELDGQGINGLILIAGVGYALWLAFRRKRPNLSQDGNGEDKGNDYRNR